MNLTSSCVQREFAAGGDADLLDHEVDVGDRLGHRMLDLDAGVHLDEIELAVLVEEFDRADAEIFELAHRLRHGLADAVAGGDVERGRGAFLPDLLVAALQRAVALAEMDGAALAVAEHLDLDVARPLEIFLEIDRVVAEGGLRLGARGRERVRAARPRSCATFMPRPPPPAAALTSTGKPIVLAIASASWSEVTPPSEPGTTGMPSRLRGALGLDLVAHQADMRGLRADEMDVVLVEDFGEARVLGQEAVAGMHGVGAGDLAGREQRRDVEIAVARGRRADADAFVGEPHMHGVGVGGRMHGDGRDAELLAGAQHAQRDLAAIGYEDFFEHRRELLRQQRTEPSLDDHQRLAEFDRLARPRPGSASTRPARGAGIWFMVFIASMISSGLAGAHLAADFDIGPRAGLRAEIGGADHRARARRRDAWPDRRRRVGARLAPRPRRRGAATAATTGWPWRATRTRKPSRSNSISVRPVSSSSLRELADHVMVDASLRRSVLSSVSFGPRATLNSFALERRCAASPSIASA